MAVPKITALGDFFTTTDIFMAAGNGNTIDASGSPAQKFGLQVTGTGSAATTWDIRLEGSLDNINFTQILQHTNTTGDGTVIFSGSSLFPALYFRVRCASVLLGNATNIVAISLGKP